MTKTNLQRRYDLDWLRVLGVALLIPFHSALIFVLNPKSIMYIKDTVNSQSLDMFAGFIHMWHMPLLFMVSGSATYFTLGIRPAGQYLRERMLRLLVPAMFGILTFIPVTTYIHRIGDVPFWEHYTGFFRFDLEHLDGYNGTFTPAHLWFIIFLFVFSWIGLPVFLAMHSNKGKQMLNSLASLARSPLFLVVLSIPLVWVAMLDLLGDKNPLYYFLVFFYGGLLVSHPSFQETIDNSLWLTLSFGIFEAFLRVAVPRAQFAEGSMQWITLRLTYELGRWALTLAALGLGHRFLNRHNLFLQRANEAAMPFYLLHMTFCVLAGYFVIKLNMPVAFKYSLIVLTASVATYLTYQAISRWNLTRWLFGMKAA